METFHSLIRWFEFDKFTLIYNIVIILPCVWFFMQKSLSITFEKYWLGAIFFSVMFPCFHLSRSDFVGDLVVGVFTSGRLASWLAYWLSSWIMSAVPVCCVVGVGVLPSFMRHPRCQFGIVNRGHRGKLWKFALAVLVNFAHICGSTAGHCIFGWFLSRMSWQKAASSTVVLHDRG